jgi:glycine dehydrogenase
MSTEFTGRHVGVNDEDHQKMISAIGVKSLEQLIEETVPSSIRLADEMPIEEGMTESDFLRHMNSLSKKNVINSTYIGKGYYPTITPAVIQRNILENPGWYTAYTPYQAEIAQGRLEGLLNFQTMIIDLTGMEIANASLLDESTAAAEAMSMFLGARSRDQKKRGSNKFFVDSNSFDQTKSLLKTRSEPMGVELVFGNLEDFQPNNEFFGIFWQYPDSQGEIKDFKHLVDLCHSMEIQVAVAADLLSLTILEPPGEWGADVVLGSTQRFGIPMGFGGPHAAYFASKQDYKRFMPGRIIGRTIDIDGNQALRMALQTREQHIKRDRATSNICTSQVLLAIMAGMYAVYHGAEGLKEIALRIHQYASDLKWTLENLGFKVLNSHFFDTIHIEVDDDSKKNIIDLALERGINLGESRLGIMISMNEVMNNEDFRELVKCFSNSKNEKLKINKSKRGSDLPNQLLRKSKYLEHPTFSVHRSETEMMRYLKKLERRDIALNHSMIPLGSCTMKLNSAAEMLPLSWPSFSQIHPFAPIDQAGGYLEIIKSLEHDLAVITGFDATSIQPNSGAQGEYSGLLVIREYHRSRGDFQRKTALIPSSAHGTNPASAVMAGMNVVVVDCDSRGNIDLNDLTQKSEKYADSLACLMITYPSTHGVFESAIKDLTSIIHKHGGQVYMDGANMNAQVGLTSPGLIGADVCHLNLHKTFAIPHGGGGPGVGPICVKKHLAPFLPNHHAAQTGGEKGIGSVSAAPFGSALILLISYGYIKMLGSKGLTKSTKVAILNANYIKSRLESVYPILYSGENGRCAHEMILDCRPFKKDASIEVTDIAKRLIDFGYHAPTVSFPVAGTMMIEPTESESLFELDRFCEAMLEIRSEIDEIINGSYEVDNNPLKNAPHTQGILVNDNWSLPYSRQKAAFPLKYLEENKIWPFVRRVDDAFGDRNLICTCAPIDSFR